MKKNGFTLIELLAVIVILAVIMLIATPMVLKTIEDARQGSFKNSAYGIIKAAELKHMLDELDSTKENLVFEYENGEIIGDTDLDYNGSRPESGKVTVNKNGQVALALHNGKYCVEKGYNESEVKLSDKSKEKCEVPVQPFQTCGELLIDTRDGKEYETVKIGEQCWMAENIKYTETGCLGKTWDDTSPHDACNTHDESLGEDLLDQWGEEVLYQWGAIMDATPIEGNQGICPAGWHIPTDGEWTTLTNYVGANEGTKLKASTWDGTDDYGFKALHAGIRFTSGTLSSVESDGRWWSSSPTGANAWRRRMASGDSTVGRHDNSQASGYSVRCLLG